MSVPQILPEIDTSVIMQKMAIEFPKNEIMKKNQVYFIPNEIEGRAELASYLYDTNNIDRIKLCATENNIEGINTFIDCVYGSIGSTSSQIFVPSDITSNEPLLEMNEFVGMVLINIDGQNWTVVLVGLNVFNGKNQVFHILNHIYSATSLPIFLSNAIAHSFYGKDKSFASMNATCELEVYTDAAFRAKQSQNVSEMVINLNIYDNNNSFTVQNDSNFLQNVVIIPRFTTATKIQKAITEQCSSQKPKEKAKYTANVNTLYTLLKSRVLNPMLPTESELPTDECINILSQDPIKRRITTLYNNYTVQNGWDKIIKSESENSFEDIGGGATNGEENPNPKKCQSGFVELKKNKVTTCANLIQCILTETKQKNTAAPGMTLGLTGKIRTAVETMMRDSQSNANISIVRLSINPEYSMYFQGITMGHPYAYKLNYQEVSEPEPLPALGGRRRRTRRGRRTKRRSRKH